MNSSSRAFAQVDINHHIQGTAAHWMKMDIVQVNDWRFYQITSTMFPPCFHDNCILEVWCITVAHIFFFKPLSLPSSSSQVFSLLIVAIGVYAKVQKATGMKTPHFSLPPYILLHPFSSYRSYWITELWSNLSSLTHSSHSGSTSVTNTGVSITHLQSFLTLRNSLSHLVGLPVFTSALFYLVLLFLIFNLYLC